MIEAGLPMVIISSLGNNKPALSFRLSSMDNILAAIKKAMATNNPNVFKKDSPLHSTPNKSLKI
jgi:electron transfer flavoprotein alpha/beta subunit